jgi:ADP-heptose:LPS heptosyltransferase
MSSYVLHRGALGDSVLLWPLLRALRSLGGVTLVSDASKAMLAARELGVRGESAESARYSALYVPGAATHGTIKAVAGVARVISFASPQGLEDSYKANLGAMFPGAQLLLVDRPLDRTLALEFARHFAVGRTHEASARPNPGGPIVLHVGAGSAGKRWPLSEWAKLRELLGEVGLGPVWVVAGEVEHEQFGKAELEVFGAMRGAFMGELGELADLLRTARVVVVADSGPAHLAAQLGVGVVALFGPTMPERWAPIGPSVKVVAPASPMSMDWLGTSDVFDAVRAMSGR